MKVFCIGRNYINHAKEMKSEVPKEPVFFLKPDTAILKNNQDFYIPDFTDKLHYEVEVVFKIGKVGKSVPEKYAYRYISEVGVGIDFTARDIQEDCKKKGLPWEKSKAFDNSAPISKFIPAEFYKDIQNLDFRLDINDKTVQESNTSQMIFSPFQLVSYLSGFFTIKMGDLIFSGTPEGVGKVNIGDNLKAYLNDKLMLDFLIK